MIITKNTMTVSITAHEMREAMLRYLRNKEVISESKSYWIDLQKSTTEGWYTVTVGENS